MTTEALTFRTVALQQDSTFKEAVERFKGILSKVDGLKVVDSGSAEMAAETGSILQKMEKWFVAKRQEMVKPFKEQVSTIEEDFRPIVKGIAEAREKANRKLADYQREQERLAAEAEARRQKEAAERAAKEAEAAAVGGPPPLPPLEDELERPVEAPAAQITTVTGSAGFAKVWTAEVTDLKALCAAIVAGKAPVEAVEANLSFLKKTAQLHKRDLGWDGVKMFQDIQVRNR